jgi:hypothetical protein
MDITLSAAKIKESVSRNLRVTAPLAPEFFDHRYPASIILGQVGAENLFKPDILS